MLIIGITGTLGAGKGTIVDLLVNDFSFKHFSVRGYLIDQILGRGMEVNRDSMTLVANDLRANNSPSFITDQLFEQAKTTGGNCVIESIRTPGEIISLRKNPGFYLFAVDADPMIRYDRIFLRKSETDNIDFDTFISNEEREMRSENPNHQNLSKCIELADFKFFNDSTIEKLHNEVTIVLTKLNFIENV